MSSPPFRVVPPIGGSERRPSRTPSKTSAYSDDRDVHMERQRSTVSDPGHISSEDEEAAPMSSRHSSKCPPGFGEFVPTESIYSFLVIYPELHRVKTGTYCNAKVGITFALIALNLMLQVSLTMIAGSSIFEEMEAYKTSLTSHVDDAKGILTDKYDRVLDTFELPNLTIPGLVRGGEGAVACCAGDECAGLGAPCCETRHPNRTSLAQLGKPAGKGKGQKNSGAEGAQRRALCLQSDSGLDCTPPTYDYMDAWDELDHNGDGVWTREEAKEDFANLGCKLGIPTSEVFRGVISGSRKFASDISESSVAPEIESRTAVPRSYFEHWRGMVALCSASDQGRCTGLIKQGVFDGALNQSKSTGGSKDGIESLETALDYCQKMLMPGGICDRAMPVTYIMYRQRVADKCGPPTFATGKKYVNPYDEHDVMRIVSLSYPKLEKYKKADSILFQFFICLILMIWYVNLLGEFALIMGLLDFSWNMPGARDADPLHLQRLRARLTARAVSLSSRFTNRDLSHWTTSVHTPRGKDLNANTFNDISEEHRIVCFIVVFIRLWLLLYMANVGTVFTLSTYSYPDLLMNAVALAFVFELPEFLYAFLVCTADKRDMDSVEAVRHKSSMPKLLAKAGDFKAKLVFSTYFWGLLVFPLVTVGAVVWHHHYIVNPIYEALMCACLQSGPSCIASERLTRTWWNGQWVAVQPLF